MFQPVSASSAALTVVMNPMGGSDEALSPCEGVTRT